MLICCLISPLNASGAESRKSILVEKGHYRICRRWFVITMNPGIMFAPFWNSFKFKLIFVCWCPVNVVYNAMTVIIRNTLSSTKQNRIWNIKQNILSAQLVQSHFFINKNNLWYLMLYGSNSVGNYFKLSETWQDTSGWGWKAYISSVDHGCAD